jgi:uncharacterized BrkB/YihY/UPF0761 family membrane protein
VQRLLAKAGPVYGAVAGFFVLISVLSLFGNVLIYGAVINVVKWEHTHGTTEMVGRAPRMSVDFFSELERGGQRPKKVKTSALAGAAKAAVQRVQK